MPANIAYLAPSGELLDSFIGYAPEGAQIKWVDSNQSIEDQASELEGVIAVIVSPSRYPVELARLTPSVRLVQVTSAGTDMIDKQTLGELGITVSNNGGGNAVSVAEHTITLLVSVFRKMQLQFNAVKAGEWMGDIRSNWFGQAHEIAGKTVGIVGLGRIGQRVARRLQGWECEILYYDVVHIPAEVERELNATRVELDELLQTSDIITLHVPLNGSTTKLISDREFDLMKPTAVLINACRGPVVDEAALIRAIEQEKIMAAGLDVLEQEPTPEDNPLFQYDNVLITPHLASFTQESGERSREFAINNTARVANGGDPDSIVHPD